MQKNTFNSLESSESEYLAQALAVVYSIFSAISENARRWEAQEVETFVLERLSEIGRFSLREYFNVKGEGDVGPTLEDGNGNAYRRDSRRERTYFSVFGKLSVMRLSYRAEGISKAIFPLDAQANLPERQYSYVLQERIALAAQSGAYKEELTKLEELTGTRISDSVAQVVANENGRHFDAYYQHKSPPKAASEMEVLAVGFDGKGIPMLASETVESTAKEQSSTGTKKMATVGVCYDVEMKQRDAETVARNLVYPEERQRRRALESDGDSQDVLREDAPKARNTRRMATVARPREELFDAIEREALARDPRRERVLAVLIDGEHVLEKEAKRSFSGWPMMHVILDLIHVVGYLWSVAAVFCGEGDTNKSTRQAFVYERLLKILKGQAGYVAGGLQSAMTKRGLTGKAKQTVTQCVTYFRNHLHMMEYDDYLYWGVPIATGVVESACGSVVQHRMEGQGKRWTRTGAEAILRLRSLRGSDGDWVGYFKQYPTHERTRNHGKTLRMLNLAA